MKTNRKNKLRGFFSWNEPIAKKKIHQKDPSHDFKNNISITITQFYKHYILIFSGTFYLAGCAQLLWRGNNAPKKLN